MNKRLNKAEKRRQRNYLKKFSDGRGEGEKQKSATPGVGIAL